MKRFEIDENLPAEATEILSTAGHDATTVLQQKLGGRPDENIASVCKSESRSLLTLDKDFADIRNYPPAEYSGIVVLRPASQTKLHVLTLLKSILGPLANERLTGQLWIVDEAGIRIREEESF